MLNLGPEFFPMILAILCGLTFHEYAHAKVAALAGDPTPAYYGRVTLNPLAHLDPLGTLMIVITVASGFGIGWGKPVLVDPSKMRNPRWDHFWSVAAGPLSNLIQAGVWAIVLRVLMISGALPSDTPWAVLSGVEKGFLPMLLVFLIYFNIVLCLFNLIPFGPLDGHWMVGAFMPDNVRFAWYRFNREIGTFLLIGWVIYGQVNPSLSLWNLLRIPLRFLFNFFMGSPPSP